MILESKFCRIDQVFCSSFYNESKSENLFLTKYYPKCPKISKERKKVQVALSLCPKTIFLSYFTHTWKKKHSNHICRLFSSLHCKYKQIPNIHTHDWNGIFIDNTFYKDILLLPITVPNHSYRYLQCKKADHLMHLDGILRKVPSQPPRHTCFKYDMTKFIT